MEKSNVLWLVFIIWLLWFVSFGFIMSALNENTQVQKDNREILSEIRDSNWMMACDDIDYQATPQLFIHCNN